MPKNQKNVRTKKYRRDRNHAEFLDNIEFFSIILKNQIILVYDPPADSGCFYVLSWFVFHYIAGLAVERLAQRDER